MSGWREFQHVVTMVAHIAVLAASVVYFHRGDVALATYCVGMAIILRLWIMDDKAEEARRNCERP